jgi:hypothetical protein
VLKNAHIETNVVACLGERWCVCVHVSYPEHVFRNVSYTNYEQWDEKNYIVISLMVVECSLIGIPNRSGVETPGRVVSQFTIVSESRVSGWE